MEHGNNMSTLLTPIVTQLDIDRERFKQLINGDLDDTVQLEFRIEKSIAGMVRDRINELGFDLSNAVQQAQDAAQAASTSEMEANNSATTAQQNRNASESARDESVSAKDSAISAKDESIDARDLSRVYRDQAEQFANSLVTEVGVFGMSMMYPSGNLVEDTVTVNKKDFVVIGQAFDSMTDRVEFVNRKFEVYDLETTDISETYDIDGIVASTGTLFKEATATDSHHYFGDVLPTNNYYAVRFTDSYINLDLPSANTMRGELETNKSPWTLFKFDDTATSISKPSISIDDDTSLTPKFTCTTPTINGVGSVSNTYFRILDNNNKIIHDELVSGIVTQFVVNDGVLTESTEYRASIQYTIDTIGDSPAPIMSPFSDAVTFVTESSKFMPYYYTKSSEATSVIDVEDATVYRVNAATNKTLTLSQPTLPSNRAMSIIIFVEDSGGVITWPPEISWSGASEPVLGTTWTNIVIFWTGSMWIGMEGAKR